MNKERNTSVPVEEVVQQIAPELKRRGYRKKKFTWIKFGKDVTILFNIQKSQWSADVWYYNFGICLNACAPTKISSIDQDHIQTRCEHVYNGVVLTCNQVLRLIDVWEERYGTIAHLCDRMNQQEIPYETLGCYGYDALIFLATRLGVSETVINIDAWLGDVDLCAYL